MTDDWWLLSHLVFCISFHSCWLCLKWIDTIVMQCKPNANSCCIMCCFVKAGFWKVTFQSSFYMNMWQWNLFPFILLGCKCAEAFLGHCWSIQSSDAPTPVKPNLLVCLVNMWLSELVIQHKLQQNYWKKEFCWDSWGPEGITVTILNRSYLWKAKGDSVSISLRAPSTNTSWDAQWKILSVETL